MKRILCLIIVSMLIISMLLLGIGCKGNTVETTAAETTAGETTAAVTTAAETTAAETAAEGDIIILKKMSTLLPNKTEGPVETAIDMAFMKEHPNIVIQTTGISQNDMITKMTAMAASGVMPDIFLNDPASMAQYHDLGLVTDIKGYFDQAYLDEYYPILMENAYLGDELQFLPWFYLPTALIYRSDWFEEAGITPPETWDDFLAAAQKLTKDTNNDGTVDRYGFAMIGTGAGSGTSRFCTYLRTWGLSELRQDDSGNWVTDIGTPESKEAFKFFCELYTKYQVTSNPIEVSYPEALTEMANELGGMIISGSHTIGGVLALNPGLAGKIKAIVLPMKTQHAASLSLSGYTITKDCKHPEEVAEYLKFLNNNENAVTWTKATGRLPARTEPGSSPDIDQELYGPFTEALKYSFAWPTVPYLAAVQEQVGKIYQEILLGGDVDTAVDKGAEAIKAIIEQNK